MAVATKKMISKVGDAKHSVPQNITKEKLKKHLPKGSSHEVTDRVMELIHNAEEDTGLDQDHLSEQFLTHTSIMKQMKVSLEEYVNGVKYVTLVGNLSNAKSWEIVFPDRLAKVEAKIALNKEKEARGEKFVQVNLASHVSNYNSSPLIVELRARVAVAFDVANAPLRQWALMKNMELAKGIAAPTPDGDMMVVTPTVQQAAAATMLTELRPVADNKMTLNLGMSDDARAATNRMTDQIANVAKLIQGQIASGKSVESVQALNLTHGGIDDEEIEEAELA